MDQPGLSGTSFPASKSFLSAKLLARVLESEYGLDDASCQLITATLRDVYLVRSSGKCHVLYIYQHGQRSSDEIRAEWQFINYLFANGVPVAPATPRKSGELLLAFHAPEGARHGVLTRFAPGKDLRQRPHMNAISDYGCIIAQIHTLADTMPQGLKRPSIDLETLMQRWIEAFTTVAPERPEDTAFLEESAAVLLPRLTTLPKSKPCYGLVHGDVIRANAQVGDDDCVTVLDFDFCGFCWRAYDIASYLAVIRGLAQEQESAQAFLSGYQQVRTLEDVENEALPAFEAVRTIFSIGIPALNAHHWGSAYLHSFLDHDLGRLRATMQILRGG